MTTTLVKNLDNHYHYSDVPHDQHPLFDQLDKMFDTYCKGAAQLGMSDEEISKNLKDAIKHMTLREMYMHTLEMTYKALREGGYDAKKLQEKAPVLSDFIDTAMTIRTGVIYDMVGSEGRKEFTSEEIANYCYLLENIAIPIMQKEEGMFDEKEDDGFSIEEWEAEIEDQTKTPYIKNWLDNVDLDLIYAHEAKEQTQSEMDLD